MNEAFLQFLAKLREIPSGHEIKISDCSHIWQKTTRKVTLVHSVNGILHTL